MLLYALTAGMIAAGAIAAGSASSIAAAAEPIDVRVRLAWGGGEARSWQGMIRLSEGKLSELTPLGLEPDTPGSLLLVDATTIRVGARTPRSYDGFDVRLQAPASAMLQVQLGADPAAGTASVEVPITRIVRDFTQLDLDERKNRLLAQRSPGDALRVSFSNPSLIFSPGEKFQLDVQPQQLELSAGATYLLSAALGPARTEESTWSEEHEVRLAEPNVANPVHLAVPLPEQEGVYDLRLSLYPKRLTSSIVRGKAIATRKLQLVVVSPVKQGSAPTGGWQSVFEIDPANPKWWERMAVLPSWTRMPSVPRPVESGPATTRMHLARPWVELPRHAWQAYPLSIAAPGTPHLVEVEYPSDIEQTLSISLIEPNAAGYVGPIGLDSGIDVPAPAAGHKPAVRRHRLLCWPQSKTPYLLLINRSEERSSTFGKIDIQAGPWSPPPLAIPPSSFPTRTLTAYYDKPLVAENFSATEALDPVSHRGFDDWLTFTSSGLRLVETLQHSGYNALVLTAACEGSAIYPSRLLEPTPKYDSGAFFESGQDAVRKDVLEFLFRLFDRSGLVLIPGVQFAGPLPALEAIRQSDEASTIGLEPVGPDGRNPLARNGAPAASGVYYNALDDRVQKAMTAVVAELAERYGHHPSFGGVAVQLSAEGYALLPDETCSLDDKTFARFLAETKKELPAGTQYPMSDRWSFIRGAAWDDWLAWRAEKMAGLYRQMREAVTKQRAGAKLYLTTANLLGARHLQTALRPEILKPEPPVEDAVVEVLLLLGFDPNRLDDSGIIIPQPQRVVPASMPQARDQEQHWNRHPALVKLFARAARGTAQHFLVPAPLRLPDFDAASPFGSEKTRTLLISQIVPTDAAYRERFIESLVRLDATTMIDGGWLLPLGQEAALAPLAKVYRRLPAEPFETAPRGDRSLDIVVRTLVKGDKTYFYAVNPSPWPVMAQIVFAGPASFRLTPYCDERQMKLQPAEAGPAWTVEMEPFDLVGGELSSGSAKVVSWSVTPPQGAGQGLENQSRDLAFRVSHLRNQPHSVPLANASFEDRGMDAVPAWVHAKAPDGMVVEVDRTQGSGSPSSLHLVNRGAPSVWIRSSPIPTPTTGRIQMTAQIRVPDPAKQPQLRLAIEGRLDGQVYYRRLNFGAPERAGDFVAGPLGNTWTSCTISRINLPMSGLTDLRVGFDLMGDGEVWIDDVQVQDLWLDQREADELLIRSSTARLQARDGALHDCRLLVEGYWPSFLRRNVKLPDAREAPPQIVATPPVLPDPPIAARGKRKAGAGNDEGKKQNWLDRTSERNKNWWPSWMKWK
jgi:hypothetical protein